MSMFRVKDRPSLNETLDIDSLLGRQVLVPVDVEALAERIAAKFFKHRGDWLSQWSADEYQGGTYDRDWKEGDFKQAILEALNTQEQDA